MIEGFLMSFMDCTENCKILNVSIKFEYLSSYKKVSNTLLSKNGFDE